MDTMETNREIPNRNRKLKKKFLIPTIIVIILFSVIAVDSLINVSSYGMDETTKIINGIRNIKSAKLMAFTDGWIIPLGIFEGGSFENASIYRYSDRSFKDRAIIISPDRETADGGKGKEYIGYYNWKKWHLGPEYDGSQRVNFLKEKLNRYRVSRYVKDFIKRLNRSHYTVANEMCILAESTGPLTPYQKPDLTQAQRVLSSIARYPDSVGVWVEGHGKSYSGRGNSVRAAVEGIYAKNKITSSDIRFLKITTQKGYRLHEINAAVFSDDLAFIRTTLGNLEHLDLLQARFYNDTVPRSALDCSKNVEYAFNLPKGNLPKLERVDLPPVVSVDWYAFRNLPALKNINLSNTLHIADQAFEGCVSLRAVNAPKLETLRQGAFFHCNALKGLVFPRLKSIKRYALSPSVQTIAIPKTAIINTYDLAALSDENSSGSESSWPEVLLLLKEDNANNKKEPKKITIYPKNNKNIWDIFINGKFEISKDYFVRSRDLPLVKVAQHPYTMPLFNPQLTAEEITVAVGTSANVPIRFADKNIALRMAWGHSDNPSITQITADGKISASVPGNAVLTITDIVADVTLPAGKKAHVFSNWPVELKNPLRLRVRVE